MITEDRLIALIKQNRELYNAIVVVLKSDVFADCEDSLVSDLLYQKSIELEYKLSAWESLL